MEDEMRQSDNSDEFMETNLQIKTEFIEISHGDSAALEPEVNIKEELDGIREEDPLAVNNSSCTRVKSSRKSKLCSKILDMSEADQFIYSESEHSDSPAELSDSPAELDPDSEDEYVDTSSNAVWPSEMKTENETSDSDYEPEIKKKTVKKTVKKTKKNKKQKYECECCSKSYKTEHTLNEHMKTHASLQKDCKYCNLKFINQSFLTRHYKFDHQEDIKKEKLEKYQKKLKKVETRKKAQCDICNKKFQDAGKLRLHMLVHTNERHFTCDICEKSFKRPHHLKNHKLSIHLKNRSFTCSDCGKNFRTKGTLLQHVNLTHNNANYLEEIQKCHRCNRAFRNKLVLEKHLLKLEQTGRCFAKFKKPTKGKPRCFCTESFKTEKELNLHKVNVHKKQNNKYICKDCNKLFIDFNYFKLHLHKFHTNITYYFCDYCKNILISEKSLFNHYKLYHELRLSYENFYTCNFCDEKFPVKDTLKMHIRFSHLVTKIFSCASCGKWFNTCKGLKKHAKSRHSVVYKCNVCLEKFKSNDDLNKHEFNKHDIVTETCTLECNFCDRTFNSQNYLNLHKLLMHQEQVSITCNDDS